MAKAKKVPVEEKKHEDLAFHYAERALKKLSSETEQPLNVSEMTIIEIMHQKNISREAAISFLKNNQRK